MQKIYIHKNTNDNDIRLQNSHSILIKIVVSAWMPGCYDTSAWNPPQPGFGFQVRHLSLDAQLASFSIVQLPAYG